MFVTYRLSSVDIRSPSAGHEWHSPDNSRAVPLEREAERHRYLAKESTTGAIVAGVLSTAQFFPHPIAQGVAKAAQASAIVSTAIAEVHARAAAEAEKQAQAIREVEKREAERQEAIKQRAAEERRATEAHHVNVEREIRDRVSRDRGNTYGGRASAEGGRDISKYC